MRLFRRRRNEAGLCERHAVTHGRAPHWAMCLWPSSKKCQDLAFFSFILNGNSVAADRVLYSETHSSWDEHVTALTRPLCTQDAALCFGHCAPPALPMTHPFAHQSRLAPAAPTACATSALCVVAQLAPALRTPHTALYFFIRRITVLGPPPHTNPGATHLFLFSGFCNQ